MWCTLKVSLCNSTCGSSACRTYVWESNRAVFLLKITVAYCEDNVEYNVNIITVDLKKKKPKLFRVIMDIKLILYLGVKQIQRFPMHTEWDVLTFVVSVWLHTIMFFCFVCLGGFFCFVFCFLEGGVVFRFLPSHWSSLRFCDIGRRRLLNSIEQKTVDFVSK